MRIYREDKMNNLNKCFIREKAIYLINITNGITFNKLAKFTKKHKSNQFHMIKLFENLELITSEIKNNNKIINLTPKGQDIKNKLIELINIMEKK
jgi:hypothetical protein